MSHLHPVWFGSSAIVTDLLPEDDFPLMYMPVQHIVCRCVQASTSLEFPTGKEQVMIAIPLTRHFQTWSIKLDYQIKPRYHQHVFRDTQIFCLLNYHFIYSSNLISNMATWEIYMNF